MSDVKYNRSVTNTRPAVFDRELPRDWKEPMDCSPSVWSELLGVVVFFVLFFGIPWGLHLVQAALKARGW